MDIGTEIWLWVSTWNMHMGLDLHTDKNTERYLHIDKQKERSLNTGILLRHFRFR